MKPTRSLTFVLLVIIGHINEGLVRAADETRIYPPFGRKMRSEFFFESGFTELNHGSLGPAARVTYEALQEYRHRSEKNPDLWLRRESQIELTKVREALAKMINADEKDIVIVPNNTSGLNAVIRSLILAAGDRLLHWSTTYQMVKNTMQFLVDRSGGTVSTVVFNVTYPITNDEIVKNFEIFLDSIHDPSRPIKLASIEHVSSSPSVVNPIERLIPLLKARNIPILIDGAHAPGQVDIDIKALGVDYYVGGTKHMYVTRACSLLWASEKGQQNIHPTRISHDYAVPANYQLEFNWEGTSDTTPYMTVLSALQFRKDIGGEAAIRAHNHNLAVNGGKLLAARFGTRTLHEPNQIGTMVDIELPIRNVNNPVIVKPPGPRIYTWWAHIQLTKYKTTYVTVYMHNGKWWARAIPQIHNEIQDFYILENHLLSIIRNELREQFTPKNVTWPMIDLISLTL